MLRFVWLFILALSLLRADQTKLVALQSAYKAKILNNNLIINGTTIALNSPKSPPPNIRKSKGCVKEASPLAMAPEPNSPYPALKGLDEPLDDSSRCRNYALLGAVYGASENEVKRNLIELDFLGQKINFNKQNGAADALKRVEAELKELIKKDPSLKPFLQNIGGSFKWRKIAGSELLSAHSYAIAIDINVAKSHYWRWHKEYANLIPAPIVWAFERQGFIWGGRWVHFDTMHFEYRPEWFVLP